MATRTFNGPNPADTTSRRSNVAPVCCWIGPGFFCPAQTINPARLRFAQAMSAVPIKALREMK